MQSLMTKWCNASSSCIPQSNSHSTPTGHVFLCSDFFPLANCLSNDTVHYFSYCFCRINWGLYKICSMDMKHLHRGCNHTLYCLITSSSAHSNCFPWTWALWIVHIHKYRILSLYLPKSITSFDSTKKTIWKSKSF